LDVFFKEEIQKVTVDFIKALEKYRKDYVELEEVDHLGSIILLKVEDLLNKKIELKKNVDDYF